MSTYLTVLVSASLLSLIACAAPTGSEDPAAGAPAADEPAAPAADPGASEPGFAPLPERAGSSAPLPAIRSCGRALTAPTKLETQATWVAFGPAAVGAKVVTASPLQLGAAIVSGSLTRPPTGVKRLKNSGNDIAADVVGATLGLRPASTGTSSTLNNYASSATTSPASAFYLAPTATRLTYFAGFSATDLDWTVTAPHRTALARTGDTFVWSVTPGMFGGYELALDFPDACAVGALSDALGGPALVTDGKEKQGIFTQGKAAAVEAALVANGVRMHVRFVANKQIPAVDSAFATTTCSTGDVAGCAALMNALTAAGNTVKSNVTSDAAKLQANTDPVWSPINVMSEPVAIVP